MEVVRGITVKTAPLGAIAKIAHVGVNALQLADVLMSNGGP